MKNLYITLLVFCGAISQLLHAQSLKGKIFDAATKEPIIGASVHIINTNTGTASDNNGSFVFQTIAKGAKIRISTIGFVSQEIEVTSEKSLSIALEPAIENLQTVVVTGNREAALRTQTPIAISKLSPKMIEEAKPTAIYEVINKTPGVMMVNLNNEQHSMSIRQPMTTMPTTYTWRMVYQSAQWACSITIRCSK